MFGKAVKKEAGGSAGKALGGGVVAKQGVNAEALSKVVGGVGGPVNLERLNIGINFAQNFGMVVTLKWLPVDLKKWFEWVVALGLDFDMYGGMGESVSIALGLLVPAWLIYEYMHDMHLRDSF
ncbi:hypothetical protein TL16_g04032 [Triparma laevis f. inornata]|uniref:Uncharacterized protein n=1 Tax=Triparma laevis f. inornata TaxID=1714386 RepID=A0A9W7A2U4_9STRA|nr:hypothetical protein TL16_g04032 [Triparma laevis f. inornata]